MLWPDEVRQPDFKFLDDQVTVRSQEMRMAESYIDAMAEEFEPDEYVDDYRQALLEVVQAKVEGAEITKMPDVAPEEGKVVDLMEALRRSVAEAKRQRGEGDGAARESGRAPAKAAAKKAPAKKAAAKKASAKKTAAKRKSA
jgi:DNA end-binding protein Ku